MGMGIRCLFFMRGGPGRVALVADAKIMCVYLYNVINVGVGMYLMMDIYTYNWQKFSFSTPASERQCFPYNFAVFTCVSKIMYGARTQSPHNIGYS